MRKEWTRDYATGAFIRYANRGAPTVKEYEEKVRQDVYRRLFLSPPNVIVMRAEAALSARKPIIDDIEAVEKTKNHFIAKKQDYIAEAINEVYQGLPEDRPIGKNDITLRVRVFSQKHYVSEMSVYKGLKQARFLFSTIRKITIGAVDDDFYF